MYSAFFCIASLKESYKNTSLQILQEHKNIEKNPPQNSQKKLLAKIFSLDSMQL